MKNVIASIVLAGVTITSTLQPALAATVRKGVWTPVKQFNIGGAVPLNTTTCEYRLGITSSLYGPQPMTTYFSQATVFLSPGENRKTVEFRFNRDQVITGTGLPSALDREIWERVAAYYYQPEHQVISQYFSFSNDGSLFLTFNFDDRQNLVSAVEFIADHSHLLLEQRCF